MSSRTNWKAHRAPRKGGSGEQYIAKRVTWIVCFTQASPTMLAIVQLRYCSARLSLAVPIQFVNHQPVNWATGEASLGAAAKASK